MKDFNIKVSWSANNVLTWTIFFVSIGLMIVNLVAIYNIYTVIETMWLEIQQVKETNISLYQFIEEHRNEFD